MQTFLTALHYVTAVGAMVFWGRYLQSKVPQRKRPIVIDVGRCGLAKVLYPCGYDLETETESRYKVSGAMSMRSGQTTVPKSTEAR